MTNIEYIINPRGQKLAYVKTEKSNPTMVWLCGYHSDFAGSKAQIMAQTASEKNLSSLLFDYSGHGMSSGEFENGNLSQWFEDAEFMIDNKTDGDLILAGSSMGGWLSLLYAIKHPERVKKLILIAPAPDFTKDLMWDRFPPDVQDEVIRNGYWLRPSEYDPNGYKVTLDLIEDGKNHRILHNAININVPVEIIHGMNDADVPFERSIKLAQNIKTDDVKIHYIKDGDHRLSRDEDLSFLKTIFANI